MAMRPWRRCYRRPALSRSCSLSSPIRALQYDVLNDFEPVVLLTNNSQLKPLLLLYAAPALVMLGLHAAVTNQYTRYNLIPIGPFSAGAAWLVARKGSAIMTRHGVRQLRS